MFFGGSLDDTISEDPATSSAGAVELAAFGGSEGAGGETNSTSSSAAAGAGAGADGGDGVGVGSFDGLALFANLDLSPSLSR